MKIVIVSWRTDHRKFTTVLRNVYRNEKSGGENVCGRQSIGIFSNFKTMKRVQVSCKTEHIHFTSVQVGLHLGLKGIGT